MRNQRNTAEALPSTETVVTTTFDSQGRRTEYKSVTNGTQNTWLRFLYDGYLCIQVLYSNSPYNTFKEFIWDPTEPVATRPLVFRYAPNNLNLFYAFDGNKNVSDVFYRLTANGIGAHYDYAPFGATTRTHRDSSASFDIVSLNPFRFSSEYYDSELDLVYYNYRHYSPSLGRFLSRDPIEEQGGWNLYAFTRNNPVREWDILGRAFFCPGGCNTVDTYAPIVGYRPTPEQERKSAIAAAIAAGAVIIGPVLVAELSLTEGGALVLAGKIVKDLSKKIKCLKCDIQVHKAHHRFGAFDVIDEFPYVRLYECYRRHVNIMCHIKGKKGSDIRLQIPFSKCMPKE